MQATRVVGQRRAWGVCHLQCRILQCDTAPATVHRGEMEIEKTSISKHSYCCACRSRRLAALFADVYFGAFAPKLTTVSNTTAGGDEKLTRSRRASAVSCMPSGNSPSAKWASPGLTAMSPNFNSAIYQYHRGRDTPESKSESVRIRV